MIYADTIETPVDPVIAAVDGAGAVVLLVFANGRTAEEVVAPLGEVTWESGRLRHVRRQLDEYFAGRRRRFELDLEPFGTPFQREVWRTVRSIPYGETASYGEVARRLRRAGAARAVGRANATNPVCLLTPCHRVVGADGSLTGFGGGVETKRWLLEHESPQPELWSPQAAR